jgi:hypothetical protein
MRHALDSINTLNRTDRPFINLTGGLFPCDPGPSSSMVHFVCLACAFGSRLVSQKAAM